MLFKFNIGGSSVKADKPKNKPEDSGQEATLEIFFSYMTKKKYKQIRVQDHWLACSLRDEAQN